MAVTHTPRTPPGPLVHQAGFGETVSLSMHHLKQVDVFFMTPQEQFTQQWTGASLPCEHTCKHPYQNMSRFSLCICQMDNISRLSEDYPRNSRSVLGGESVSFGLGWGSLVECSPGVSKDLGWIRSRKFSAGAGEMVWKMRAYAGFTEGRSLAPSTCVRGSQLLVTAAPRDLASFGGLCEKMHAHVSTPAPYT